MRKYGYKEWDAIVAAIGHGGLKEGQVANRLLEEYEKIKAKDKVLSDQDIIDSINNSEAATKTKERVSKGRVSLLKVFTTLLLDFLDAVVQFQVMKS